MLTCNALFILILLLSNSDYLDSLYCIPFHTGRNQSFPILYEHLQYLRNNLLIIFWKFVHCIHPELKSLPSFLSTLPNLRVPHQKKEKKFARCIARLYVNWIMLGKSYELKLEKINVLSNNIEVEIIIMLPRIE